jgi:hypothetical protein
LAEGRWVFEILNYAFLHILPQFPNQLEMSCVQVGKDLDDPIAAPASHDHAVLVQAVIEDDLVVSFDAGQQRVKRRQAVAVGSSVGKDAAARPAMV